MDTMDYVSLYCFSGALAGFILMMTVKPSRIGSYIHVLFDKSIDYLDDNISVGRLLVRLTVFTVAFVTVISVYALTWPIVLTASFVKFNTGE